MLLQPQKLVVRASEWAGDLYRPHGTWDMDYVLIHGGRGSSKTYEISQALTVKAFNQKLRIAVAREHLKSIEESAKVEIEDRIRNLALPGFRIGQAKIDHEITESHFFFIGLSKMSEEDIKGLALVDIVWVEEAHRMSHASWELLRPTIRKEKSQIWASWNPKYRTDAIAKFEAEMKDDTRVWTRKVNWSQNAFFPEKSNRDRRRDKVSDPERYAHIWEGEYDDVSAKRKVLPFALLRTCVDAWDKRPTRGAFIDGGLDVADTGTDKNALCVRCGPELFRFETWRGSQSFTPSDTARKAKRIMDDYNTARFYYDAGGVGAGVRGPMIEAEPDFVVRGVNFGGKVDAPTMLYIRGGHGKTKTNEEYFRNWGSQAGWLLRVRANNTQALMNGDDIDPEKCLFINPEIKNLEDVLAEMAQPEWDDDTGKLKIEKQPREPGETKPPSPDCFDAARLAFAKDASRMSRFLITATA